MNCCESIEYIHSLMKFGINPGLERIEALCELLGNPQKGMRFIHVAGTNGKGSTSTMISSILMKSGYNTGLFTSPYVIDFRERIQFNGEMIEEDELAISVSTVRKAIETLEKKGIQPTEFEAITATAFCYFKKKKCDFVVLEVGLGGRLDSTNIIDCPIVNVITSISKDHVSVLGNTISEIASEKCGTLKQNGRCICYPDQTNEALSIIKKQCLEKNCELIVPDKSNVFITSSNIEGTNFVYDSLELFLPLAGMHMVKNCITAIEAIKIIKREGFEISDESIAAGIAVSIMPARLEVIKKSPLIILDGGHNEGCAKALERFIKEYLTNKKITAIISMMADKDYESYLKITAPLFNKIITTYTNVPRALGAEELCNVAMKYSKNCTFESASAEALKNAITELENNEVIIVCGSFYFAGEIRNQLKMI